jgi:hypothetical protein
MGRSQRSGSRSSPHVKPRSSKRKYDGHRSRSSSIKRQRSDPSTFQKETKKKELPRKQEADSTDSIKNKSSAKRISKSRSPGMSPERKKDSSRKQLPSQHSSGKDEKKSDKRNSHRHKHESKEMQTAVSRAEAVIERPFDQTAVSINERFTSVSGKSSEFVLDENVTIEIERVVAGRAVPFAVPPFWSDAVQMTRRPDEGKKPLSEREEFLRRDSDDDEERRIVKVNSNVAPEKVDRKRDSYGTSDRKEHGDKDRKNKVKSDRPRREGSGRNVEERGRGRASERLESRGASGGFGDHVALVVSTQTYSGNSSSRAGQRSVVTATAAAGRPFLLPAAAALAGDLRKTLQDRESAAAMGVRSANTSFMPGYHSGPVISHPTGPQLPDFAHRPNKYTYEEWKERPELIPKGRSYYEHDDRDAADDQWNSRFRGRGMGRGRGRARGRTSFDQPPRRSFDEPRRRPGQFGGARAGEDLWKHDKFEELEPVNNN